MTLRVEYVGGTGRGGEREIERERDRERAKDWEREREREREREMRERTTADENDNRTKPQIISFQVPFLGSLAFFNRTAPMLTLRHCVFISGGW